MTGSTDEDAPPCRQCGDPVASSSEHRIVSTVEDGRAVHYYFCDDDCLESWES